MSSQRKQRSLSRNRQPIPNKFILQMFWRNLLKLIPWNSLLDLSLLILIWIRWTVIEFFLPLVPSSHKQPRTITAVFIASRILRLNFRSTQQTPPVRIQMGKPLIRPSFGVAASARLMIFGSANQALSVLSVFGPVIMPIAVVCSLGPRNFGYPNPRLRILSLLSNGAP
jgi:hypothetical protein